MKYFIATFFFLLPFHAFLVTFLKCKLWVNTNILRFWKEIFLLGFFVYTIFYVLKRYKYRISKIYEWNYLLWTITTFALISLFFVFFPFNILDYFWALWKQGTSFLSVTKEYISSDNTKAALLGFKYDVFFLFAIIIWYYLPVFRQNISFYLKSLFASIFLILIIFVPVYISGHTLEFYSFFGYSTEASTYNPNWCLAYSQNVEWWHNRFQATFWGPIRFSVFLTVFYLLYMWFILYRKNFNKRLIVSLIILPTFLFFLALFFAYTKTAILWFLIWTSIFAYLTYTQRFWKVISKTYLTAISILALMPISALLYIKRDLFLHLWAMINRLENLKISFEMLWYNMFGHWLWIAGPASQLWALINYDAPEQSIYFSGKIHKFLPENWYMQIFLEQGILGGFFFIGLILMLGVYLYRIVKNKKDFLSIWFFSAFVALAFMANFTHSFEESATSYLFFLLVWAYLWGKINKSK